MQSHGTQWMSELVLDPRIRDFVLLPIVLLMLLTNIFRHYLMMYIGNPEKKADVNAIYATYVGGTNSSSSSRAAMLLTPARMLLGRHSLTFMLTFSDEYTQASTDAITPFPCRIESIGRGRISQTTLLLYST